MDVNDRTDGLRIAQVVKLTGVGTHTLRAWERRYGVPTPDRTGGRQRMYSLADVEMIRKMQALSLQGVPLLRAAEVARAEAVDRVERGATADRFVSAMVSALLAFDERRALNTWTAIIESLDVLAICERVVVPVLQEIGDAWHAGEASVAQEHFATVFIRGRLDLLSRQSFPLPGAPTALLSCLEGENHELGLMMLSVLLRFQGFRTIYLGQDVPNDALIRTAEDSQPEVLVVAAGNPTGVPALRRIASALAVSAPLTAVVCGGKAFEAIEISSLPPGTVFGGAELSTAVQRINELGRRPRPGGTS